MTKISELHGRWSKEADYKKAYDGVTVSLWRRLARAFNPRAARSRSAREVADSLRQFKIGALEVSRAAERVHIGQLADDYLEGRLSFQDFMMAMPDQPSDEDVAELVDLIEHQPKRGGFLGASPEAHDRHMERIRELVRSMVSGSA